MIRDITFGQYVEANSLIHKLDPRTKMIVLITVIVCIFAASNIVSLFAVAILVLFSVLLSRVPIKLYLKNIKAVTVIVLFTAILNILYTDTGKNLSPFSAITVTTGGLFTAAYLSLRIILLITVSSVLTYTTTPNDLTDAIERLCLPLTFIGLSNAVHTMALMMTIALRFIPTLVDETEKIMNAQKARGADLESGSLTKRIKALIPILIPLFISAVRRSYELADAMECRCYNGGKGRQRMKVLKMKFTDYFSFLLSAILCAGIALLNIFVKVGCL